MTCQLNFVLISHVSSLDFFKTSVFWLDSKSHGFSYSWNMLEHVVFPMGSRHWRGDENDCKKRPVWHFKISGCVLVAATVNVKINKKEDKTYKARTRFTMLAVCLPPCKQSRAKTYGRRPACRSPYIHSLKARCVKSRDCYLIYRSLHVLVSSKPLQLQKFHSLPETIRVFAVFFCILLFGIEIFGALYLEPWAPFFG